MKKGQILLLLILLTVKPGAFAQKAKFTKYENVVYGYVAGNALLMDIYQPANSNHLGIIYIAGTAFGSPALWNLDIGMKELYRDSAYAGKWPQALVEKGYTVFMINHSFAPRFRYPDILFDCQKAVRFVRYNAKKYDINPAHLGAMGHSSGGYLASMLGVRDTVIDYPKSGMDSVSSKVQSVVTLAAPFNLSDYSKKGDTAIRTNVMLQMNADYMGQLPQIENGEFVLSGKYSEASPITHVSNDDASFLIYYSDNDHLIPVRQAQAFYKKLMDNGVQTNMTLCHNCKHDPIPDMLKVDTWFRDHLK